MEDKYFLIDEEEFNYFINIYNEIRKNDDKREDYNSKFKNYISHSIEEGYKWEHNTDTNYNYKDKIVLESYYCLRKQEHIYSINATFFEKYGYRIKH